MKKLKEMFFSERGMSIVNMLFCRIFGVCSRPRLCEPVLYVLNIQAPP